MRKYIREIIRVEGERQKLKPSRYVKSTFEQIQQKKYGVEKRKKNQAKGTHIDGYCSYLRSSRKNNYGVLKPKV